MSPQATANLGYSGLIGVFVKLLGYSARPCSTVFIRPREFPMPQSLQREWLFDIIESAPSLLFVVLLRSGVALELAGWCGAASAAAVLVGFHLVRRSFNPILLGINIHLFVITPLVVGAYALGAHGVGATLEAASYRGVLVTILLVGVALTALSPNGFAGVSGEARSGVLVNSFLLLAATVAGILFAFSGLAGPLAAVAVPVIALFGLRRFLIARWQDRQNHVNGFVPAAGIIGFSGDSMGDA